MKTVIFRSCTLYINSKEKYCVTIYPDGTRVNANPLPEQEETARKLGYENTWELTKDHDAIHHALSEAKGLPYSPALYRVAHGEKPTDDDWREEELVILFQKTLNILRKRNLC